MGLRPHAASFVTLTLPAGGIAAGKDERGCIDAGGWQAQKRFSSTASVWSSLGDRACLALALKKGMAGW